MILVYVILSVIGINILIYFLINSSTRKSIRKKLENENRQLKIQLTKLNDERKKITFTLNDIEIRLSKRIKELEDENNTIEKSNQELLNGMNKINELHNDLKTNNNDTIEKISSLYSDVVLIQYTISENYLRNKNHPAITEAKRINELKKETKKYIELYRQMLYKYESLIQLFPELSFYIDDFETINQLENIKNFKSFQDDFDRTQLYLNNEEYQTLNIDERNQIALDRYIKGHKTNWQIGRDYELYCGQEYEKDGWEVEYYGIEKKIEDLGRDLIAKKGRNIHIIQCKYWSQNKIIHEKHIVQLFGTTIVYGLEKSNSLIITPVFITNTKLSNTAYQFAKKLDIIILHKDLKEFPRIKCNINKNEFGEITKIYHLPFDQQYDRTKIREEGEFYASTIKEAVDKGFRRAYKYYGSE